MTIHIIVIANNWDIFCAAFLLSLGWVLGSIVGSFIQGVVLGVGKALIDWLEGKKGAV